MCVKVCNFCFSPLQIRILLPDLGLVQSRLKNNHYHSLESMHAEFYSLIRCYQIQGAAMWLKCMQHPKNCNIYTLSNLPVLLIYSSSFFYTSNNWTMTLKSTSDICQNYTVNCSNTSQPDMSRHHHKLTFFSSVGKPPDPTRVR